MHEDARYIFHFISMQETGQNDNMYYILFISCSDFGYSFEESLKIWILFEFIFTSMELQIFHRPWD